MSHLVLIAGVSRSGKSSLARELCSRLDKAIHLDQDNFVKAEDEIPLINDRIDWETPESIDWPRWHQAIENALSENDYVISEGIFALNDIGLITRASLTLLLELDETQFKARRKQETRWGLEPDWFIQHVWDLHQLYHNPHHIRPDITLFNHSAEDVDQIIKRLRSN